MTALSIATIPRLIRGSGGGSHRKGPLDVIDGPIVKHPCVYILASKRNGTLYVGVTSDVLRRTWAHKSSAADGFTKKYRVHLLARAEFHETMADAILRESTLKSGAGLGSWN
jgi:putative endonuclease